VSSGPRRPQRVAAARRKFMGRQAAIDPNRLFAAADALLLAMHSREGKNALVVMHIGNCPEGKALPADSFTHTEFVEAMSMLVRMGFAESDSSRR
jgi:hypothetical protein